MPPSSMTFPFDTMYCGAVKRGDVFLWNTEHEEKIVVILQDTILNERLATVIAAPIEPYKAGSTVFKNEVLLSEGETGMGKKGICMLHRLERVPRTRLVAKKGEVKEGKLQELFEALDITLGRFRDK